jgi:lipopolysaccharide biosynthesis protein
LEAAVLRQNKHLDIKDVRWLPQFRQAKSQAAALLPFGFSLTKTPRYAVFFHFFQSVRLEETFAAFSDLPPGCDLYITTVDEQTKRQVMKVFARGTGGSVDVKAAPFIQNGCEAAITVFRDVTRNYEYCLMIHSDRGEEGGWYRTQRQILTARANAGTILAAMEADSSLGMVAVASHDHKTELPADDDLRWVIARAGLRVDPTTQTDAPAGSMAWVRSAALVPFLQAEMTAADFSEKRGLGTTITKLSYLACENFGFNWLEVVDSLDVNQNTEAPRLTITDVSDLSKAIHCRAE